MWKRQTVTNVVRKITKNKNNSICYTFCFYGGREWKLLGWMVTFFLPKNHEQKQRFEGFGIRFGKKEKYYLFEKGKKWRKRQRQENFFFLLGNLKKRLCLASF